MQDLIGIGQPEGGSDVLTIEQQKSKLADALMAAGAQQAQNAKTPWGAAGPIAQAASAAWLKSQKPQTTLGPWETSVQGPGGWQTSVQAAQPSLWSRLFG